MREYTVREYDEEDYDKAEHMPIEEVIQRLNSIKRGWLPDYSYSHDGSEEEFERFANQMAMLRAIEILDKVKEQELFQEEEYER